MRGCMNLNCHSEQPELQESLLRHILGCSNPENSATAPKPNGGSSCINLRTPFQDQWLQAVHRQEQRQDLGQTWKSSRDFVQRPDASY